MSFVQRIYADVVTKNICVWFEFYFYSIESGKKSCDRASRLFKSYWYHETLNVDCLPSAGSIHTRPTHGVLCYGTVGIDMHTTHTHTEQRVCGCNASSASKCHRRMDILKRTYCEVDDSVQCDGNIMGPVESKEWCLQRRWYIKPKPNRPYTKWFQGQAVFVWCLAASLTVTSG